MDFEFLFQPAETVDAWLTGLLDGAPLLVALGIAFVLGLRHATDPDHLVATTSLVASDGGSARGAVHLGAWWGVGHAGALVAIGLPLIFLKTELPGWLETGAEKAIGVVILVLAARVIFRWRSGRLHTEQHSVRSPQQALAIGTLHGLAGTGAVVLLLIAAMPTRLEAAATLAVFAPMSIASMALCTGGFAWVLTRPAIEPIYRAVLVPGIGVFGLLFGLWYTGVA